MADRRVVLLTVGVLLSIGIGVAAILSNTTNFVIAGTGAVLIIIGLVGLMPLFATALGD